MSSTTEAGVRAGALSALLHELVSVPETAGILWERSLTPGLRVGRYELIRPIGRGGFGVVWEARDTEVGRAVAWKALRGVDGSVLRQDRLLAEAEIAARLSHPNIVTLHEVGRTEQGAYLVFELLRGQTLAVRLGAGPVDVEESLRIATNVAAALAYAHDAGVVHRDLQPGNVFLCSDGGVKVLDFGLAFATGVRKLEGGTPPYMAPEQHRGAPEDERSDVFALGVLLFRMLSGELPFAHRAVRPDSAPTLDIPAAPALSVLVSRMLELDPVERPRDGSAVLAALGSIRVRLDRLAVGAPGAGARIAPRTSTEDRMVRPGASGASEHCERGRQFLRQTRRASLRFAAEMFQRAIELDREWALPYAGLAEACGLLHMYYPQEGEELERADRASTRALELDPLLPEAHSSRGLVLSLYRRPDEARCAFERALSLDPKLFEAYYYLGRVCFREGDLAEAARLFAKANATREDYQAAFFTAQVVEALGAHDEARNRYAEALAIAEKHMDLNPDDPRAATMRAVSLCRTGRQQEGLRWAEQARTIDPLDAGVLYNVACLYALEGQVDSALDCIEQVLRAGFRDKEWMQRDPDLDSLRSDPRFQALMTQP